MRSEIVPRQRHWMESAITPVPLTRHQTMASRYQGCSQKTLAPLATVLLPLTRQLRRRSPPPENARRQHPLQARAAVAEHAQAVTASLLQLDWPLGAHLRQVEHQRREIRFMADADDPPRLAGVDQRTDF